ncbi:MAG: biotin/lipoyl-containing protein, partial [Pseudomonadota bacterium]
HPVTEMITGQDLVEWQLRVAAGEPLPCVQEDLVIHGHAIEARVYAEDPHNNFLPAAGEITLLREPSPSAYVRIDTGVVEGDSVGVYYDPMIAKLITWDLDRERALQRMAAALASYAIAGVRTNLTFLGRVVEHEAFKAADLSTGFIAAHESALLETAHLPQTEALPLATLFLHLRTAADVDGSSPWHRTDHWRVNAPNAWDQRLHLDGIEHELRVTSMGAGELQIESELGQVLIHGRLQGDALVATLNGHVMRALVAAHGEGFVVQVGALRAEFAPWRADLGDQVGDLLVGGFNAPMNGAIVSVLVEPGQAVAAGDTLVIMEAMKMEHAIKAPVAGEVTEIFYAPGDLVEGGAPLLGFVGAA